MTINGQMVKLEQDRQIVNNGVTELILKAKTGDCYSLMLDKQDGQFLALLLTNRYFLMSTDEIIEAYDEKLNKTASPLETVWE